MTRNHRHVRGWSACLVAAPSLLMLAACSATGQARDAARPAAEGVRFTEMTQAAGIDHRHHRPQLDPRLANIGPWMSSVGAAACATDFDGDGRIDLYVTDSLRGKPNRLYRNLGGGRFEDVAASAGLAEMNNADGASMDCVWGDYDSDGRPDLYLVRWGHDALLRNRGDGSFEDVTERVFRRRDGSPGTDWANGNTAIFLDFDLDGRLDIYVGNYFQEVDLWNLPHTRIMHDDFEVARNGGENFLYHQQPDGRFVEKARRLGIEDPGWTLSVGSADLNNDGWPDLYCANDFGPDQLFLGGPGGTFTDVTNTAIGPDTKKGMNVDFGDFNNDGWLDVYVTNITTAEYLQEGNMLWCNNGVLPEIGFSMTDIAGDARAADGGWGWGGKFFDADNDGHLDIVTVNGFVSAGEGSYWYDLASWTVTDSDPADSRSWPTMGDRSFSGYERTRLFMNTGRESFVESASTAGIDGDRDGRGVVVLDFDDDGQLDLFIANQDAEPYLYRNQGVRGNHWLGLRLIATVPGVNRDAIGARASVVSASGRRIRERDGGTGYAGQSDPRLHFGLGKDDRVELLEVRWPDGGIQVIENPPIDRYLEIRQDPAAYVEQRSPAVAPPRDGARRAASVDTAEPTKPHLADAELERVLSDLEAELQRRPDSGHTLGSRYRQVAVEHGKHDRALAFLGDLVDKHPQASRARIEFGNAYVDKLPTCGGLAAIVCKGTQARRALDQLDIVLATRPDDWGALYARGMNHLHWPKALRHSDDAVRDLTRCIELQTKQPPRPWHVRAHVALGDALAKAGRIPDARRAWEAGQALFPADTDLTARLALTDDTELFRFVERMRSLERPIDTDLSFLDDER